MLTDDTLKQKHLEQAHAKTPKNFGILMYTYNNGVYEKAYYNPKQLNIGDYVQTLAARQFLPTVSAVVDRDLLALYNGPKVNMIMNAWYYI